MAIDLLSENSSPVGMSPRISFSHDLSPSDINFPVEQRLLRSISSSSVDFDFCIHQISFNQESTSAEELFSNGKILPTQVKEKIFTPTSIPPSAPPPPPAPPHYHHGAVDSRKNNSKNENDSNERTKCTTGSESNGDQKRKSSKSFWQFKRSSSLNCGNGYARSLCPLPPLLRSNSTGSASSSKRSSSSKDGLNHKQHSQKTPLVAPIKHPQFSSSNSHQKPPIKKNGYGPSHGNRTVRINPVLNVPSANLFGLGAIFSSNKEMKNKKK